MPGFCFQQKVHDIRFNVCNRDQLAGNNFVQFENMKPKLTFYDAACAPFFKLDHFLGDFGKRAVRVEIAQLSALVLGGIIF